MKTARIVSAAFVALYALIAGAAVAQSPFDIGGMMRGVQYGPLMVLSYREVQKELKLDKSQTEALKKLQKEQIDAGKKLTGDKQGSDPTKALGLSQQMQEQNAEYSQKAQSLLTDDQRKRLSEIRVQIMGVQALFEPEIQTALALTDVQKENIASLSSEYTQAKMRAVQEMGQNIFGGKGKMDAVNNEYKEKVAKILTAEQNAKFKEMEGAPFKDAKKLSGF